MPRRGRRNRTNTGYAYLHTVLPQCRGVYIGRDGLRGISGRMRRGEAERAGTDTRLAGGGAVSWRIQAKPYRPGTPVRDT